MQQRGSYDRMRRIRSLHLYCESSSLLLSNSNTLAKTGDVQASGKLAIKAKLDSCLHHLMLVSIFGQQLDNEVHMLVQLTKLALLYCSLKVCIQASTCSVVTLFLQGVGGSSCQQLSNLIGGVILVCFALDLGLCWTATVRRITRGQGEAGLRKLSLGSNQLFRICA